MKTISLTQGQVTLVDDSDYVRLSKYKWYATKANGTFYAIRHSHGPHKTRKTICMSRVVMNAPKNTDVDHRNLNTLDNRKSNLRICTRSENTRNRFKPINNKSGFKGVVKYKNRWQVTIVVNNRTIYLGRFKNKILAAKAYDKAAIKYFRKFARLNIERLHNAKNK
jgi:hypothetical protein